MPKLLPLSLAGLVEEHDERVSRSRRRDKWERLNTPACFPHECGFGKPSATCRMQTRREQRIPTQKTAVRPAMNVIRRPHFAVGPGTANLDAAP